MAASTCHARISGSDAARRPEPRWMEMSTPASVVIAGAGMAGFSVVSNLRDRGYAGRLVLIGDEPWNPYNRPPLSKAFLTGAVEEAELALRPASYYHDKGVEVVTGRKVVA